MYFDAIAKIVSERTGCDISAVKPESKFSELGIDSLDTVELLMNLEDEIGIVINRSSFNFARYSSHLMYLLQRLGSGSILDSNMSDMYSALKADRPAIARCVDLTRQYFQDKWNLPLSEEEQLYLFMHINRICTREGLSSSF